MSTPHLEYYYTASNYGNSKPFEVFVYLEGRELAGIDQLPFFLKDRCHAIEFVMHILNFLEENIG